MATQAHWIDLGDGRKAHPERLTREEWAELRRRLLRSRLRLLDRPTVRGTTARR